MLEEVTLKKSIEFAIATEENGAKFYARLANKFSDKEDVSELFARLAKDEEVHKRQFSALLEKAPEEKDISGAPEKTQYLKAMSVSEFFSTDRGPFADADSIETFNDALGKAFELEKATLSFYQAVSDVLGENDILNQIMDAEKEHITAIMKVMISGGKFRSLQDKW
ncbi:MAG: hypothetical protein GF315_03560 [candidate division Zixibacteria bacterium]|nr:hypothetical protein [candidate division Zixibacteria bacterium]